MKNEAIFSQKNYPALHALVHRYGISKWVMPRLQAAAREELQSLLIAVQEVGYAQGRGYLGAAEAEPVARDQEIARLRKALEAVRNIAADRERFVARGPAGFMAAVQIVDAALDEQGEKS
jgi:hypothetical protein